MEHELLNMFDMKLVMVQKKKFESLPNEIFRIILAKVELQPLIGIRGVSRRWQHTIESICNEKSSLLIQSRYHNSNRNSCFFNGLVEFGKNCAAALVVGNNSDGNAISMSHDVCVFLVKLFPRLQNLAITAAFKCTTTEDLFSIKQFILSKWSTTLVSLSLPEQFIDPLESHHTEQMSAQLDSFTSLKRLDFTGLNQTLKQTTLNRLEHYSLFNRDFGNFRNKLLLGDNKITCTSLNVLNYLHPEDITQFVQHNPNVTNGLTHLSLCANLEGFSTVCDKFVSLRMLSIYFVPRQNFNADLLGQLVKLPNLSQLALANIKFSLATLALCCNLPLKSVRTLTMPSFDIVESDSHQMQLTRRGSNPGRGDRFDGDHFCRCMSAIFPCLSQLFIPQTHYIEVPFRNVRERIARNLHHFVHLRKHSIERGHDDILLRM